MQENALQMSCKLDGRYKKNAKIIVVNREWLNLYILAMLFVMVPIYVYHPGKFWWDSLYRVILLVFIVVYLVFVRGYNVRHTVVTWVLASFPTNLNAVGTNAAWKSCFFLQPIPIWTMFIYLFSLIVFVRCFVKSQPSPCLLPPLFHTFAGFDTNSRGNKTFS